MKRIDRDSPAGLRAARDAKRGKGLSTEEIMPFDNIDGPFLRRSDGSTCVYMTYPGLNLSLMNRRQRQFQAFEESQVIAALNCDAAAVFVLPERVDSESNLALADRSIEAFRASAFGGGAGAGSDADRLCLEVLERHIRPEMAREAVAGANVSWRCYLGMRFSGRTDEEIMGSVGDVAKLIEEKVRKKPRVLSGPYEILDFLDVYFKGWTPVDRYIGEKVVYPAIEA